MAETFLNGKVVLHRGDCLEVLPLLEANSIDSCVTDPPYHLTSIVKRFGKEAESHLSVKADKDLNTMLAPAYKRLSKGFMGKQWDGGDVAFRPETWVEVLRVLKPGAHLIAFSGTRTYHRMACAIEDAGFEIRDQIGWCYGSGFPKSHDVSKGIDRIANQVGWFGPWLKTHRESVGISQKDLAERGGFYANVNHGGLIANWELGYGVPTTKQFNKVCELLSLPFCPIEEVEREFLGQRKVNRGVAFTSNGPDRIDITSPATESAIQWQGWGTALKPAWEPIVLARKPLSESSIAANVLKHGTGGINVDGCRVACEPIKTVQGQSSRQQSGDMYSGRDQRDKSVFESHAKGRWPANLIHDGSEEVLEGFPDAPGQQRATGPEFERNANVYGKFAGVTPAEPRGDSGSAARFFYTAKADVDDRLGSKHPTVKPVDLIQYLVRLVTPKGGTVLDLFAGTGSTGEAAFYEGMLAVLIERESEYQADIVKRMGLCLSGPDLRRASSVKQESEADLPLFWRVE